MTALAIALFVVFATADPRVKDPHNCKKVCTPQGYEGEMPEEFPDGVKVVECKGTYCAKAAKRTEPPAEGEEGAECKSHPSCSVFCSEVCCVCLRSCV